MRVLWVVLVAWGFGLAACDTGVAVGGGAATPAAPPEEGQPKSVEPDEKPSVPTQAPLSAAPQPPPEPTAYRLLTPLPAPTLAVAPLAVVPVGLSGEATESPRQPPPDGGKTTSPFPKAVAGFAFGISPKGAESLCRSAGGAFVRIPTKGDDKRPSGACTEQPVRIDIETDGIFLEFCGTTLCEVILHLGKEAGQRLVGQLTSVEKRLVERYGSPNFVTSDVASAVAQCEGNLPVQLQRVWLVPHTPGKPGGRIVLAHSCSGATDGASNLLYQNVEGVVWRSRERERRNNNY